MWGKQEFQSFNSKSLLLLSIQGPTAQNSNDVALNSPLYSMKTSFFSFWRFKMWLSHINTHSIGHFFNEGICFCDVFKKKNGGLVCLPGFFELGWATGLFRSRDRSPSPLGKKEMNGRRQGSFICECKEIHWGRHLYIFRRYQMMEYIRWNNNWQCSNLHIINNRKRFSGFKFFFLNKVIFPSVFIALT